MRARRSMVADLCARVFDKLRLTVSFWRKYVAQAKVRLLVPYSACVRCFTTGVRKIKFSIKSCHFDEQSGLVR